MITLFQARKILGKSGKRISEDDLQLLLDQCYALAEVMFEHFQFTKTFPTKGAIYAESKKT
jgi:hypothetical protein